jgi:nucleoside-diphosphate-sugar epimerase
MLVVAITGATGYIGKHLVADLVGAGGYGVRILSRDKQRDLISETFDPSVEIIEGDINDTGALQSLLKPGCTVVNLVYLWEAGEAVNLESTRRLLNACTTERVGRLIHCSTAAVSGRVDDEHIDEKTPCRPITEYGITKLKIEEAILEESRGHFDAVILRPTAVFGVNGEPLKKLTNDLVHGNRWRNYAKSCLFGNRRMNLVHVANVVAAMIFLIQSATQFESETFIVSDDEEKNNNFASVERSLMQILRINEYPLPRLKLPLGILSSLLTMLGRNNVNPRCNYDSGKLRLLGFKPPVSFEDGLAEYAEWYRFAHLGFDSAEL